jgi:DNA-binding NarL/FixJ family response regulator
MTTGARRTAGPAVVAATVDGAPIRVVLADDHLIVREGVGRLLATQPDLEVVGTCSDLDALLAAVDAQRPDVVVTDIRMPPTRSDEGIRAAARLRATHPEIGVVVLSQYAEPAYALMLLDGGSARRAYLLKERVDDVQQLAGAIRAVAGGGSVIDPAVVETLIRDRTRAQPSPLEELTPRERDVLREMAEGKNNAAIAQALFLTERSVEKVIHSIFQKLGIAWDKEIHTRVMAVILYLAEGRQSRP